MPLARPTTVPGQGANLLATRKAAYENIQVTLDHLRPTLHGRAFYQQLKSGNKPPFFYPVPPPHPRFRIPFWNIAPGDTVRIRENAESVPITLEGRIGTVQHVDRLFNRVFLKERIFKRVEKRFVPEAEQQPNGPDQLETEVHRGILYGDLQLIIGKYDLSVDNYVATILRKTPPGEDNPSTRQLLALKMTARGRRWDSRQMRFLWDRIPGRVRALKPGSGEMEPWLVPTPRDPINSPKCPKRVPWTHEEGYEEGKPVEGTIRKAPHPPSTPVFDTAPEDALRATWEPPDLRAIWAQSQDTSALDQAMPEMQPRYDPEFGNLKNKARRKRLNVARTRHQIRKYLRSRRWGWIREKVEMPVRRTWRGPGRMVLRRPPNKQRQRRIAQGKDPDVVFGAETGKYKDKGYGGLQWPT